MWLRFHCRSFPAALMINIFVLLLHPVSTQKNRNPNYFLDQRDNILLKGPDNPGNGTVVWEWKPHSGQHTHQLGNFTRDNSGKWTEHWNNDRISSDLYQKLRLGSGNVNLIIQRTNVKFAGLFTLTQIQPTKQILKQYELFGIKVEASPQRPVEGSDVTLSCTISRLPDTVSLRWKPVGSSQQNRRNTDQIRLNNTVYLMVRHVTVEDGRLYQCEVRENGNIVFTSKANFTVDMYDFASEHIILVITRSLVLLIFTILTVVFCRRMYKISGLRKQRQTSPNSNGSRENESYRLSNLQEIQQMQDPTSFIGK
ncbi:uncharacterized protein [Hemitrygon akajei]|uniref:uncharacterized protein n=1 Tax=Hemitrygon akajei TaxID=2704970 RepID=UPI003BF95B1A